MQRRDQLKILLTHLAILLFSQIILIFLMQMTMQFIILQDRLPSESLEGKSFEQISELQKSIASSLEDDLRNNADAINKRYYEIVFNERNGILFWSSLMWALAFIVPGYYILSRRMSIPISKLEDPLEIRVIGRGILYGIVIFFIVSVFSAFLNIVGWKPKNNEFQLLLYNSLKGNPHLLAWSLYSVGLITGIIEEWFFRGMILKHYISSGLIREGLIISSILFGALHYSPDASLIIPVLLSGVGMMFGYLYIRFGSIWVPIAAHSSYNSIIVVLAYFYGDQIS